MKMRGNRLLKILDRYIGIPLVFSLGILKRRKKHPKSLDRIGILKTAAIGDTILLSAIIEDIFDFLPNVKVVLFCGSSNYEIAKLIAEQYSELKVVRLTLKNLISDIKTIRGFELDVLLDFGSWPRINAVYSFFSKSSFKVGFRTPYQYRHYIYDEAVEHRNDIHEIFNYKNILKTIGVNGSNLPTISLPRVEKNKNLIVIHMFPGGTKSYLKEWPEEYWVELVDYLTGKGYSIALTGAKSDRDRALKIYNQSKRKNLVEVVAGKLSLKEVALLLKRSTLVISVNTGIMHLASALGCNLVALHGPTSSKRWGPLNKNSISIQSPLRCSPCLNLGFEYGCNENKCMKAITMKDVIESVKEFINLA
ncbi:MAG: glycosyltransferase family 9 protein [Desulfurobacteriaceae bacterium]